MPDWRKHRPKVKTGYGSEGAENRAFCLVIGGQKLNQIGLKMVELHLERYRLFQKISALKNGIW